MYASGEMVKWNFHKNLHTIFFLLTFTPGQLFENSVSARFIQIRMKYNFCLRALYHENKPINFPVISMYDPCPLFTL